MKKLLLLVLLLLSTKSFAQQDFITVWDMSKPAPMDANTIRFNMVSTAAVAYTWTASGGSSGSGHTTTGTITGLPAGEIITLSMDPINLKAISFSITSPSTTTERRLINVAQWGSTVWSSMENSFAWCSNLNITATDLPNLSQVSSMVHMFLGCSSLTGPANINNWDTSQITSMVSMFHTATAFNQNISNWNTSSVTNMAGMFLNAINFNQNIGTWDTSNVVNMNNMFNGATSFNQNIGTWDTSKVTNMFAMFANATAFNQNIDNWNTSEVTDMNSMFEKAKLFNSDISNWNTSNVTNMSNMFAYAESFNKDISNWNTSKVTNMATMFQGAQIFNQNIGSWDTSNVTSMRIMLGGARAFNQNISSWDTSNVTDMRAMFGSAFAFNQNIGNWNTSKVTDMSNMFQAANSFNQDISNWDVSNVIDMSRMFQYNPSFNQNIGSWQLNPNVDMTFMLDNSKIDCQNYSLILQGWAVNPNTPSGRNLGAVDRQYGNNAVQARTTLITDKGWTIIGDSPSSGVCGNPFITVWDMSKPTPVGSSIDANTIKFHIIYTAPVTYTWTSSGGSSGSGTTSSTITGLPAGEIITLHLDPTPIKAFSFDINPLITTAWRLIDIAQWGSVAWNSMENAFANSNLSYITATDLPDLSGVTNMSYMFYNAKTFNHNIGNWNTSKVTNMDSMFRYATAFNQDISNWDTSKVTNMFHMFQDATSFNQNIGMWNTSKVTNMSSMFNTASVFDQNISDWDTSQVITMDYMFYNTPVFNQNIGNWNTSKVTDMGSMFRYATAFNQDISNWDTSKVTNMFHMFQNATSFNQNIGNWDTSEVTDMSSMFNTAIAFGHDIGNWDTSKVTNMDYMFYGAVAFNQNIGNWNTSQVTNMNGMFMNTVAFNQNIDNWNTTNVNNMSSMFAGATAFNQNIGSWNTANVTNMSQMFSGASSFNQNIGSWQLNPNVDMTFMLDNSKIDCQNYSLILQGWAANPNTPSGRNLGAVARQYGNNAVQARTTLITNKGWTIIGDSPSGQSCGLDQTITATDMVKTYGDTAFVPTATASSGLEVSYTSADNSIAEAFQDTADGNKWKLKIKKAGQVNITAQQSGNETYNPAPDVVFRLTINKAALTITANALSKEYGTADPALTYTATGLVNNDDQTALTGTLSRAAGEAVDTYAISQGTLDAENYTITYTGANFSITAATGDFVTVWDMSKNPSAGYEDKILFRINMWSGEPVNYFWTASDGSTGSGTTGVLSSGTVAYVTLSGLPANGIVTLNIKPTNLQRFEIIDMVSTKRLIDVLQWGTAKWTIMGTMFSGCSNLNITATDVPDLSKVTDMSNMFNQCTILNGPANINNWNMGSITFMRGMFYGASAFNQPIGNWNTAKVTNMAMVFFGASSFDQPIGSWNTANVTDMNHMFKDATSFNQNINSWNTAKVTSIYGMFSGASAFNQPVGNWNTASVQTMSSMFENATSFNQNINSWNTANVTTMNNMFSGASAFNQPVGSWNTANVTNMNNMFKDASSFNQNINSWNTAKVTGMYKMFSGAAVFNQSLDNWNTTKVEDMRYMFQDAKAFNQNIGGWDTQNVWFTDFMFYGTDTFNQNINNWNTTNLRTMPGMFANAVFNMDISSWNTAKVIDMEKMFQGNTAFNQNIGGWNTTNVSKMSAMFAGATAFNQNIGGWKLYSDVNMTNMLDNSGMDCQNYSFTLNGWAKNSGTPSGRTLGAAGLQYGTNAQGTRALLTNTKGWTITGDSASGQSCGLDQTITATDMVKTYGDAAFVPAATSSSGLEVSYVSADNSIAEAFQDTADGNKWKLKIKKAGQVNITAQQPGNETYNPAPDVVFRLTINKAPLTITANALSKEYGTADPVLTYTATGLVNNDDQTALTGTLSRAAGEAVGTYAISQGTLDTENYTITYTAANFSITAATGDFVTVWDMSKPATGSGYENKIAFDITTSSGGTVDYFWTASGGSTGSGTIATGSTKAIINGLPANEIITLNLKPTHLKSFKILSYSEQRLTNVLQWGTVQWATMRLAFYKCFNLNITATDIPDFSSVTDVSSMFYGCQKLNSPNNIDSWNMQNITSMAGMFDGAAVFNQNIGSWNTQNVTDMSYMFSGASAFNQDIGNWNTASVQTMSSLFNNALVFNQNIGSWSTQNVTNMGYMFQNANSFNQNIGNWNTSKVTNMSNLFSNATSFNQNINNWDTQKVVTMSSMFSGASSFNQDISNWNTANVTNMSFMFDDAVVFNQNINSWNTQNVTNMISMFSDATVFNKDLDNWNTANVISMRGMFSNTENFNQNINSWNTANVTDMALMFYNAKAFNQDISSWNTANVTNMSMMFEGAKVFNQNIDSWNISKVTAMANMFTSAKAFNQNIGNWELNPNVEMLGMLNGTGMDCQNYSFTLQGWANNANTPSGRNLGSVGRQYGTNAVPARTTLITDKGWTITGDSPSGQSCGLDQTITATDMVKTYGDAAFVPTATASSGLEVSYVSADNSIAEAFQDTADGNKWKITIKKAGQVNITAQQPGNETYNPAPDVVFRLTINKAPLTITANALSKEYGTADPALTYTATGLVNNDDQTALTGTLSRAAGEAVGTYAISQGTLDAENYTITYTAANFSITAATGDFVTVWDMSKPATGSGYENKIAFDITTSSGGTVDYFWTASGGSTGSGTIATGSTKAIINGLPANEIITLNLKPTHLKSFKILSYSEQRLTDVLQWGTVQWATMRLAFYKCFNLNITATDIPDFSSVTDVSSMFYGCQKLNSPNNIDSWNMQNITSMAGMFNGATVFNQNIGSWNTQNVTDMSYMFFGASVFNQDIGNWNTVKVANMAHMFNGAKVFNQNIGSWNTQNVTNMSYMFRGALVFNQNIGNWNTSKVTNMSSLFSNATSFNQNINNWDTQKVVTMNNMFRDASAFNQNISSWNTQKVTDMGAMFLNARAFNQNINSWNTQNVINMSDMFSGATDFNKDLNNWNTANVIIMANMFSNTENFNQSINSWNTANVTDMALMFYNAKAFNQDISSWDTAKVTSMINMFAGATAFNQNIGSWQLHPVVNMVNMLDNSGMDCQNYSFTLQGWAANPGTPSGRLLGAANRQYGTNAVPARTTLITNKSWTITDDSPSGQSCGLDQTITAADITKTYGDTAFVPTATASSGLEVSYTSADNSIAEAFQDTADGNKWKLKIKKAGQVNITAQQPGNETYNPAPDVVFRLTINKAPLTITANAQSKEYGTADPALTYTATGLVNNDDHTALTGTLSRAAGEAVGTYAISQGTLDAENYTITYTAANFSITAATGDFVTVWDPNQSSSSLINAIKFDITTTPGGAVDYFWKASGGSTGIGTIAANSTSALITGLPANEIITLNLKPKHLKAVKFHGTNVGQLVDITQWGTVQWSTMKEMLRGASSMKNITATDIPDLSKVTNMSMMFQECNKLNGPANIGSWNTGNITDMSSMFVLAQAFNQDIGSWNTSNVTNMNRMFQNAEKFNQNIGSWNTSNVTNMAHMFNGAKVFNQNIGNWNTANVTTMNNMFQKAEKFNQNIGGWNTFKVTDMNNMFSFAYVFNQDIGNWNTANVTTMNNMFSFAEAFNQDIGSWNTAKVTTMRAMFLAASKFNQNIGNWNTENVTDMNNMFAGGSPFNQDIGNWNTANVTDMYAMFQGAKFFNQDISSWNTAKVTNMSSMFAGATAFNQNIGSWQLHPVVNMANMLDNSGMDCQNYSFTLQGWANNASTPSGRNLGSVGRQYGTNAVPARTTLITDKGWTITGDSPSGQSCGLDQTITATDITKIYGDIPFLLAATASSGLEVSYVSADNSIAEAFQDTTDGNKWKIKIKKAGQVNITAKQAGNETYNPAADVIFKLTINKASLTITANAQSKEYGTADPAFTYTATGFVNNDDQTALTGTLSRAAGEVVGTYAISQGTLDAENYTITYTGADLTITKATLNIVAEAKSKVYGSVDPVLTYTVTGLANGDDQSIITGALTRVAGEAVGTYAISQGTLDAENYTITYTGADLTITKATLIIRADAKSKVYGSADPALTYTVTGLANGDDQSIITGTLIRTAGENIGTYEIQQGTLATTANYDITYTAADFNITKATLNIVAEAKSKVYGSVDPALTYTVTGLANGDDQSIITGALTRVAGEAVGTYEIQQGTLATAANYDITYTAADFDITKATLNILAEAKTKVYGSADPALTYTVTGLENGDDQSVITGALTRVAGEAVGTYSIEQGTLGTTANYDITYTAADFNITKATLNIVAEAKSKVYGSVDPVLTYTVTGLANGDDQSIITGALTRVAGEAVGTYSIEQGTLTTTANYDIVYTAADFTITKATLNIVAEAKSKIYGSVDPALTYTVTGLANGDDQSIITGTLIRIAGENIGTYEIQQGTLATTANYDITYTAADFNITKATLNIVAEAKSKIYGSADPVLTYTVTGLENGDDQSIITGNLTRTAGEAVGTYSIEQGTLATTANYDLVYTTADFTITKATLNIVAEAKSKVYGSVDPALTYTVTGLANGDDQSIITGALTRVAGEAVGTYSIEQGTLTTTANYDLVYTAADFNITKATLNIIAEAKSKVYGSADPALTYTVTGLANGDDQSIITGALTRVAGEAVGTYEIQQGTLSTTANYNIVYTAADFNITKATLNIVAEAKTKVYGSADPVLTYTVTGLENGDDQSIITGALNRVAGEAVGTYSIEQGTLATTANYDLVYTAADFNITKATLIIRADAKSKVYGSADPALTYTVTGLENGDDQSIITGTLIRIAGENIGTYEIQQGTLATTANYDLVYTAADFNITKATLNIVAEAKTKVYGSADPALTYTVTGLANGDDQSIITGTLIRTAGENIGTYEIQQGTLATTANYDITYTAADFNITKATLNIVAEAKSKVYGSVDPALTYTVTGLANGDDQSIITGALTRVAGEAVGTYAISQGTLDAENYTITYTGADLTITKATLIIRADAKSKVYGSADPALTYTVTGLANGDDQSIITGTLIRTAGENIGTYEIQQGTLATTANYDITYTAADFNITKATLNIVAEAKSKVYGSVDPALTYTVTGLANGDDQSIITGALTRVAGEAVGTYEIQQGTLATAANYDITYTAADFDITKATLNIVAEAKSKVYGSVDPALTYTVTGLANGDDQSIITGNLTRTAGENIGTYEIQQGTLATTANYDITYTAADFDITKATLNIVAEAKSKVYGSADPTLTYTVIGLENGDDQSIITGTLIRIAGENIGTYEIQQGTLTTTANYDITYTAADFNITKATLNIVAEAKSKVYGSADPALTYTVTGLVNGDDQSIINGALTRVAGEAVGTYEIQQGTLTTTANYDIVYTTADFNITKATLNIVAEAKSKVYGSADPALTYTVTGFENGDDQNIITGALIRVAGEAVGTYSIEQGTLSTTANYDITYTAADFNITKATLNIVAEAKSKVYGSVDPALTYTVTGFENGDDQSIITGALTRVAGEAVGTYSIQQGTLATTANYDITYTAADFNITKATLNIVAEAKTKVYGSVDPALTYTVTGFENGDDQNIITGALIRVAGEAVGTYSIEQGTLSTTANYDITYTAADFNITKATLNIVAEAKSKVYGSADPTLTYTVTGLANGDDQSIITGTLIRIAGENIGTYEIQQGTLATTANYDITYTAADLTITKATLNIVAEAKSKVYGSADPVLTYTVTGLANGDDQSIITGALTRVAGENIGTYEIQQGTLATAANYDITYTAADFDITKATLNILAEAKSKVYGSADPALTYTVTGFENGDDQTVITGTLIRVAGEEEGTYAIEQGTLSADNYEIVYTGADFIIFKTFTIIVTHQTNVSCNGSADGSATVEVAGGTPEYSYSWSPYGGTEATASGLTSGIYIVTITDANGVAITQEFTITEPPVVELPVTITSQTFCKEANPLIRDLIIEGSNIKWYATVSSSEELSENTALVDGMTYYATQTINGCESKDRAWVVISLKDPMSTPVGASDQEFGEGATVADLIIQPAAVIWYDTYENALENSNPLMASDELIDGVTYYAVAIGECYSLPFAVTVHILEGVQVHNGISTDGDGINDYLIIDNIQRFPDNKIIIYNRWGKEVWNTRNYGSNGNVFKGYAEGVKGFKNGEKLANGTYYYILQYLYERNGESKMVKKTGYLHLENN